MFDFLCRYEQDSQTIAEARKNVKQMSLGKEILAFIGLLVGTFLLQSILAFIAPFIYTEVLNNGEDAIYSLLILFGFIFIPIVIYFVVTRIEKRSIRSIGFSSGNVVSGTLRGLLIGFLMFLAVVVIGYALGVYKFNGYDLSTIVLVIPFLVAFSIQSFAEEIETRGWALTFVSKRHGIMAAVLVSNLFFVASHLINPGIDILAVVNIFIVATLFAVLFLKYDCIWVCGGAHASWNFSQGIIFGFNVSGMETPSVLKFSQAGQSFLAGGKFGPESSLIATFVILTTLIIFVYWIKK